MADRTRALAPAKMPDRREPYKLTPAVAAKVVAAIKRGNSRETAAAIVGVTARTLRNWLKLGAEDVEPYAAFSKHIEVVEAEHEDELLGVMRSKFGDATLREILEYAGRRWPHKWNPTLAVQMSGAIATVAAPVATPAAARAAMRELFNLEAPEAPADMFGLTAHAEPDPSK